MNETVDTILSVFSILTSIVAVSITVWIYTNTKRRDKHQNLLERNALYQSKEMFVAVQRLWKLHREEAEKGNMENRYIQIMQEEQGAKDVTKTLHYQRRLVSHFYRGLATMLQHNLIDRKLFFEWWGFSDLEIVPKILVPIEKRLAEYIGVPEPDLTHFKYLESIMAHSSQKTV